MNNLHHPETQKIIELAHAPQKFSIHKLLLYLNISRTNKPPKHSSTIINKLTPLLLVEEEVVEGLESALLMQQMNLSLSFMEQILKYNPIVLQF